MPDQALFSGKYIVQEEIARGSMGIVYKALDHRLNRLVAIKVIDQHLAGDPVFTERLLREARAMARLDHEKIITIHAVEEEQGTPYIVMEYFPSSDLRARIKTRNVLPVYESVDIALQIANALAFAHSRSIVHRDIKPSNVLVDNHQQVKLINFGIAAALYEASITSTGQIIGTPEYISPEQAAGMEIDGRTDLYSLGIVLYEMLVGHTPFRNLPIAAIFSHLLDPHYQISLDFPVGIPSGIQSIVESLIRRYPHRRQTAQSLVAHLKLCLQALPTPPGDTEEEFGWQEHSPPSPARDPTNGNVGPGAHERTPIHVKGNPPGIYAAAPRIFFCYRREDSADVTGRIYDWLLNQFGEASLFKDVDSIPYGLDFRAEIEKAISTSTVVLAIIGRRWLSISGKQRKRDIDNPSDYVRIELVSALTRQIPVIPVLIAGAAMPAADTLPDDIRAFSYRNAIRIKPDPDFRTDMERLIRGIVKLHEPR